MSKWSAFWLGVVIGLALSDLPRLWYRLGGWNFYGGEQ